MKKWQLSLALGLILAITVSSFAPFYKACGQVRGDTLRLHILANSDSAADQALKLAVRDAILRSEGDALGAAADKTQAEALVRSRLGQIEQTAREVLQAHGCSEPVCVRLENLYFATRAYDGFTLPAGRYDAVRVEIGAHAGQNWFCVLFPPLCVPAAAAHSGEGYTGEEQAAVTSPYQVRFAAVELLERLRERA